MSALFLTTEETPGNAQWNYIDSTLFNRATVIGQSIDLAAGASVDVTVSAGTPVSNSPVITGWSGTLADSNARLVMSGRVSGNNIIVTIANVSAVGTGVSSINLYLATLNNV